MGRLGRARALFPRLFTSQVPFAAAACVTVLPVLIAVLCRVFWNSTKSIRPYLAYDARISMAMRSDTVHPLWAPLVPFVALLVTLLVDCTLFFQSPSRTASLAVVLHYALDAVLANIVTICITEVTKLAVGKLRPDYLDRCQPAHVYNTTAIIRWGVSQPPGDCTRW